jgi:hypothetical protein
LNGFAGVQGRGQGENGDQSDFRIFLPLAISDFGFSVSLNLENFNLAVPPSVIAIAFLYQDALNMGDGAIMVFVNALF